ncbi:MAG TPA: hypothetical protein VGO93_15125 [Candidatus Xenobia bacterium]
MNHRFPAPVLAVLVATGLTLGPSPAQADPPPPHHPILHAPVHPLHPLHPHHPIVNHGHPHHPIINQGHPHHPIIINRAHPHHPIVNAGHPGPKHDHDHHLAPTSPIFNPLP